MPDALTNTEITEAELEALTEAGRQRYVANRPELESALAALEGIGAQIAELTARQAALRAREDVKAYNSPYYKQDKHITASAYKEIAAHGWDWITLWTWVVMGEHPDWPEERANLHAKAVAVAEWDKGGLRGGVTETAINLWRAQIELAR